jgi:phage-related holin
MKEQFLKYLSMLPVAVATYFSPAFTMLLAIGFFVVSDFITGMLAAKKRGELITSKKMRPTVTKGIGYMVAILVAHVFQVNFSPSIEIMKIVSGLIALIELKSVDENLRDITGKSLFKQFTKH